LGKEEGMRKPAERYHQQAIEAAVADGKPLFKTGRKKWQEWNIAGPLMATVFNFSVYALVWKGG